MRIKSLPFEPIEGAQACGRKSCPGVPCDTCGWLPEVAEARKEAIRNGAMKKNSQGLEYLPVKIQHVAHLASGTIVIKQSVSLKYGEDK